MASSSRCTRQRMHHQTSEATRALVQRSLAHFPTDLLHRVLHTSGRHARRVCRHWRDAYGPLTCGLHLTHLTSHRDLRALPAHLASIPTLAITAPPQETHPQSSRHLPNRQSIIPALPRTFPRLTSLDLDTRLLRLNTSSRLLALKLLHPNLTSLHLRNLSIPEPLTDLPTALPLLRSLTFTLDLGRHTCNTSPFRFLNRVTAFFNLRHLHVERIDSVFLCTEDDPGDILSHLARLPPTLTHLHFHLCSLCSADLPGNLHCFQSALPNLRHLHLPVTLPGPVQEALSSGPCHLEALASTLSDRPALTHLELALDHLHQGHTPLGLHHLAQLPSLRVLQLSTMDAGLPAPVLQQLAAATTVTRLLLSQPVLQFHGAMTGNAPQAPRNVPAFPPSLLEMHLVLEVPDYTAMAHLSQLSVLRSLKISEDEFFKGRWEAGDRQPAVDAILSLTALTMLHLPRVDPVFTQAFLGQLSTLVHLRRLRMYAAESVQDMSLLASASSTLTHLQLNCRRWLGTRSLPSLRCLPSSVRCLGLLCMGGISQGHDPWAQCMHRTFLSIDPIVPTQLAPVTRERQREPGQDVGAQLLAYLLPLPPGLRVLALHDLRDGLEEARTAIGTAARLQDCLVLDGGLPADERHFGCNGYC